MEWTNEGRFRLLAKRYTAEVMKRVKQALVERCVLGSCVAKL